MTKAKKTTKIAKKPTFKPLPFNRKNALALADRIYKDERGVVSFMKLCEVVLKDVAEGGRSIHCAVGEMYHNFVGPVNQKSRKGGSRESNWYQN